MLFQAHQSHVETIHLPTSHCSQTHTVGFEFINLPRISTAPCKSQIMHIPSPFNISPYLIPAPFRFIDHCVYASAGFPTTARGRRKRHSSTVLKVFCGAFSHCKFIRLLSCISQLTRFCPLQIRKQQPCSIRNVSASIRILSFFPREKCFCVDLPPVAIESSNRRIDAPYLNS